MSQTLSTVVSVAITFVVTLALNTTVNYYASDRGTIGISKPIPIEGKTITVLSIENYSRDFVEGLAIELPATVPITALISDAPVTFTDTPAPHQGSSRVVKVNQISPRLITHIYIPTPSTTNTPAIRALNLDAMGLTIRHDEELEPPLRKALFSGLIVASIYAIFAFGITYYTKREIKPLREQIEVLKSKTEGIRPKIAKMESRITKQRLLMQARLFDYSKELNFWRNTFRTLVLKGHGDTKAADEAIETVTKTLKTHGTNASMNHFEEIKVAAAWLVQAEQDDKGTSNKTTRRSHN